MYNHVESLGSREQVGVSGWCAERIFEPDCEEQYQGHAHDGFEVLLVRRGSAVYRIGGELLLLERNDILLIEAGTVHEVLSCRPSGCALLISRFLFTNEELRPLTATLTALNYPMVGKKSTLGWFRLRDQGTIRAILDQIQRETHLHDAESDAVIGILFSYLSVAIRRVLRNTIVQQVQDHDAFRINTFVKQAILYIELHYTEAISVEDLATCVHLSPSYFRRVFKEQTGLGPKEYLNRVRLEEAQRLLVQSDQPITQIAGLLGFCTSAHFTGAFGRYFGTSPHNYRRLHCGKE